MKIIGITGGVGAGKSTVLDYLEKEFNACVLQADKIGHLVMEPDGICYDQVIALFGKKIIKNDKTIERFFSVRPRLRKYSPPMKKCGRSWIILFIRL